MYWICANLKGQAMTKFNWNDLNLDKEKEEPLNKQQGIKFSPPKKEIKKLLGNKNEQNKKIQPVNTVSKSRTNPRTVESNKSTTSGIRKLGKVKLTKQEEKEETFKEFKTELGITDIKLLINFYDKAIELLLNTVEDLGKLKQAALDGLKN